MAYRKFKADQLFDGYRLHGTDKVLITDDSGKIQNIVPVSEAGDDVQIFSGILSPGLINCHCHLELSHLKNVIPPHTSLIDFLCSVVTKRNEPTPKSPPLEGTLTSEEIKQFAIASAEKEMFDNGIVAVGDIGNTADTALVKSKSNIHWQNFVEVLGFYDAKADENIRQYQTVANTLEDALRSSLIPHRTSLVPHAPYSVSAKTFE